ncbi:MAG: long-chain N-acyl amino acid synthase [Planctomycetota bacterium]
MFNALAEPRNARRSSPPELGIGLARSQADLSDAFRLIFQSYFQAGLVSQKPSGIRLTPHHLLPTSEVLVARHRGKITSTVSLFGDGKLGLPMQTMYPQQINQLRDQGIRLAEVGSLADERKSQIRFIDTFAQLGRLLAQLAYARGYDGLVAVTHPKHARLYRRVMGFNQIGDLSDCPYANGNPAVALYLSFHEHRGTDLYDQYFGEAIPQKDLAAYRWPEETRRHFRKILERDHIVGSAAGIQGYYTWACVSGNAAK